ncbi:hypothetical protein [Methylomonas albis]|uniref:Secreted protein n=1 Tax=Methylomonas albis TaxID=1854563 RepID=A0ABR9D012_9GAMM|nr:hypothetical protein [Methylomonas albis]MBD9355282.1 hypothetical protein [Methylomonas albis]
MKRRKKSGVDITRLAASTSAFLASAIPATCHSACLHYEFPGFVTLALPFTKPHSLLICDSMPQVVGLADIDW